MVYNGNYINDGRASQEHMQFKKSTTRPSFCAGSYTSVIDYVNWVVVVGGGGDT